MQCFKRQTQLWGRCNNCSDFTPCLTKLILSPDSHYDRQLSCTRAWHSQSLLTSFLRLGLLLLFCSGEIQRHRGMNIVSHLRNSVTIVDTLQWTHPPPAPWRNEGNIIVSEHDGWHILKWNTQVMMGKGCWDTHSYSSSMSDIAAMNRNTSGEQNCCN